MAEGMGRRIRKAMLDHRVVWELDADGETLIARCDSCAYLGSELETFEHQANIAAEVLAANGYGKLEPCTRPHAMKAPIDGHCWPGEITFDRRPE